LKVLFIDDDGFERFRFSQTLKLLDLNVELIMAENGWDAIHLLSETKPFPDIIIHDINMPDMNGIEFLEKIRNVDAIKWIPKIAFTSSRKKSDLKACQELGVNSFIIKPIKPLEYTETLNLLIRYWALNTNK
jgi:CheY-like chemotaxis protein